MKGPKNKILIWWAWVIVLLLICVYFTLFSSYDTRPLLYKFCKELWVIGLPYIFFTLFYILAITHGQYRKIIHLILLDVVCTMLILGSIYWFYEGEMLAVFSTLLFIGFASSKVLVLMKKDPIKKV